MNLRYFTKQFGNILMSLFIILFSFELNAQFDTDWCATDSNSTSNIPSSAYSHSTDVSALSNTDPIVINVFYWQINLPDGSNPDHVIEGGYGGTEAGADTVMRSIRQLNIDFEGANVFFKYQGWDSFNSPTTPGDPTGYYNLERA